MDASILIPAVSTPFWDAALLGITRRNAEPCCPLPFKEQFPRGQRSWALL